MATPNWTLIGEGGFGKVFRSSHVPGHVMKMNKDYQKRSVVAHEYAISKAFSEALELHLTPEERMYIGIIHPTNFKVVEGDLMQQSSFHMEEIIPCAGDLGIQAYLGLESHMHAIRRHHEIRGLYLGSRQLGDMLKRLSTGGLESAIDVSRAMGVSMAVMFFGANLTGTDVEVMIGKTSNGTCKLYVLDHDQNNFAHVKEHIAIQQWAGTLSSEPYYPLCKSSESALRETFIRAFINKAETMNRHQTALRTIQMALDNTDACDPLPLT